MMLNGLLIYLVRVRIQYAMSSYSKSYILFFTPCCIVMELSKCCKVAEQMKQLLQFRYVCPNGLTGL